MNELQEFYRFKRDAGDYSACDKVKNWLNMPEETKEILRETWRAEDIIKAENEAKIAEMPRKKVTP